MKKEQLIELGIDEDIAKQVMAIHGTDMTNINKELRVKEQEALDYKEQLDKTDKDLIKLQKNFNDNDDLKQQIKDLSKANEELKSESVNKINKIKRDSALNDALTNAKAKNPKAVSALLDQEAISFDESGLKGVTEQLEKLKETDSYLFDMGTTQRGHDPKSGGQADLKLTFEDAMSKGKMDDFFKQQIESEEQ